jgi:hypothetical protein
MFNCIYKILKDKEDLTLALPGTQYEPLGLIQGVAMDCCVAGLLLALTKPGQMGKTAT